MKKVYTHAVVGAGIVGLSVALKLQSLGNNVLVLDKKHLLENISLVEIRESFIPEFITNQIHLNLIYA